ncbi:MAG: proteasome-associated ATPase [Actinomycetota bacterium]
MSLRTDLGGRVPRGTSQVYTATPSRTLSWHGLVIVPGAQYPATMTDAERRALESEIEQLRQRLALLPDRSRQLEEQLLDVKGQLAAAANQNSRLTTALRDARQQIENMRTEVDKLSAPPNGYGILLELNDDDSVDVLVSGRKMRVNVAEGIEHDSLFRGAEVVLNESMNVVMVRGTEVAGEVVTIVELLEDGVRAMVTARNDERRVVSLSDSLRGTNVRSGDLYLYDAKSSVLLERLHQPDVEDLLLEEVPDVTYEDIGGLDGQIEQIADAVELPFLHTELFAEYRLPAPKGILLYGPPGCGKTMIAKAVANSLAKKVAERTGADKARSYFINVKGPELLNKYVGETERQIRQIFVRAREKSEEGWPVIVFFDEMDSMFRARGTGVSSDMESTIVPQLLAELDGVEGLSNVMVIGATNREDLIDPAILRPGRLDVKIKVDRPSAAAARQIFARYLLPELPFAFDGTATDLDALIDLTVREMYRTDETTEFLEVTYQGGDRETLYFKDFASGAMIDNIVRRAKKYAIKRQLSGEAGGITPDDLVRSIRDEFHENEDLPNTTNPDDWARISGRKGERIIFIRTLVHGTQGADGTAGGKAIERTVSGQYL